MNSNVFSFSDNIFVKSTYFSVIGGIEGSLESKYNLSEPDKHSKGALAPTLTLFNNIKAIFYDRP